MSFTMVPSQRETSDISSSPVSCRQLLMVLVDIALPCTKSVLRTVMCLKACHGRRRNNAASPRLLTWSLTSFVTPNFYTNPATTEWCRLICRPISLQLNPAFLIPIIGHRKLSDTLRRAIMIWHKIVMLYDKIVTLSSSITQTWFSPGWGSHVSRAFCSTPHQKHFLPFTLWCSERVIFYVWEWSFEFL